METKDSLLRNILRDIGSGIVAFSGGVDSTFLLAAAREVMGDRVVGVTGVSPSIPAVEVEEAKSLALRIGARHLLIESREMENAEYVKNPSNRCYFCKGELFSVLREKAAELGLNAVMDGTNSDDLLDVRPGRKAALEHGVRSPLLEAGITKEEIRTLSRQRDLPTWDKPSYACLSSRFPTGTAITEHRLRQVESAEHALRGLGFRMLRVRYHGDIARIEVDTAGLELFHREDVRRAAVEKLKSLGFSYITLDLQGYRPSGPTSRTS